MTLREKLEVIRKKTAADLRSILIEHKDDVVEQYGDRTLWASFLGAANLAGITCEHIAECTSNRASWLETVRNGHPGAVMTKDRGREIVGYVYSRLMKGEEVVR